MYIVLEKRDAHKAALQLVQHDRRTLKVGFSVPRHADGVDLMGLTWVLRMERPDGETDAVYLGQAMPDEKDGLALEWTVGPFVSEVPGLVRFQVQGIRIEAEGEVKAWQSGVMYAAVGLQVDVETGEHSEEITELERLITTVGQTVEPLVEEVNEQIQTVEQLKGSVEEAAEELRQMDAELTEAEKARADAEIERVAAENLRAEKDTERAEIARRAEEASAAAETAAENANTKADMADEAAKRALDAAESTEDAIVVGDQPVTEKTQIWVRMTPREYEFPTMEDFNALRADVEKPWELKGVMTSPRIDIDLTGCTEVALRGFFRVHNSGYLYIRKNNYMRYITETDNWDAVDGGELDFIVAHLVDTPYGIRPVQVETIASWGDEPVILDGDWISFDSMDKPLFIHLTDKIGECNGFGISGNPTEVNIQIWAR